MWLLFHDFEESDPLPVFIKSSNTLHLFFLFPSPSLYHFPSPITPFSYHNLFAAGLARVAAAEALVSISYYLYASLSKMLSMVLKSYFYCDKESHNMSGEVKKPSRF